MTLTLVKPDLKQQDEIINQKLATPKRVSNRKKVESITASILLNPDNVSAKMFNQNQTTAVSEETVQEDPSVQEVETVNQEQVTAKTATTTASPTIKTKTVEASTEQEAVAAELSSIQLFSYFLSGASKMYTSAVNRTLTPFYFILENFSMILKGSLHVIVPFLISSWLISQPFMIEQLATYSSVKTASVAYGISLFLGASFVWITACILTKSVGVGIKKGFFSIAKFGQVEKTKNVK